MRRLIIDTANIVFRASVRHFATPKGKGMTQIQHNTDEAAGLALHMTLQSINKAFKDFKPDQLIFTFEGKNNWRKAYTAELTEEQYPLQYKANRVYDPEMQPMFEMMDVFRNVMMEYTSSICLRAEGCEGDDLIAGLCYQLANESSETIVLSSDRDFVQLLSCPNVRLIDPATGTDRLHGAESGKDLKGTPLLKDQIDYYMFKKYVRGDKGDNVHSAFPRVRETKIKAAFEDELLYKEFMENTWTFKTGELDENGDLALNEDGDPITIEYRVGDLFKHNKNLIDLTCQPEHIKEVIKEVVNEGMNNISKYDNFFFMKFLGEQGLNSIAGDIQNYSEMLNINSKNKKMFLNEQKMNF